MTNLEIIRDYKNDLLEEGLNSATIRDYVRMAERIMEVIDKPLVQASIIDIKRIRTYLISFEYSDTQYNKLINHCYRFFDYVEFMKLNEDVNSKTIRKMFKLRKIKNTDKHGQESMSVEEFEKFYSFLFDINSTKHAQRKKVATLLACGTGLRRVEIADLMIDVIDFENKCVDPNKTKFDKGRAVKLPLSDDVLFEIQKLLDIYEANGEFGAYLFMTDGKLKLKSLEKKLNNTNLLPLERKEIKELIEHIKANGWKANEASVNGWFNNVSDMAIRRAIIDKRYTPHAIRKSRAKWMLYKGGYTIDEIAEFFGHSNTSTTREYVFDEKVVASSEDRIQLSR